MLGDTNTEFESGPLPNDDGDGDGDGDFIDEEREDEDEDDDEEESPAGVSSNSRGSRQAFGRAIGNWRNSCPLFVNQRHFWRYNL